MVNASRHRMARYTAIIGLSALIAVSCTSNTPIAGSSLAAPANTHTVAPLSAVPSATKSEGTVVGSSASQDPDGPTGNPTTTRDGSDPSAVDATGNPPEPASPRVSGSHLTDATTGEVWIPRGVNYPSFGYACAQGWGMSSSSAEGGAGAATARAIADWHANVVRLPLNQDCWNGTNDVAADYSKDAYAGAVGAFVEQLNTAGLVVILDLHSRKVPDEETSGQRAMPDAESLQFFTSVAAKFKDNPSIMFDAFNEPYSRYDDAAGSWALQLDWACWRDGGCQAPVENDDADELSGRTYEVVGMQQMVEAIRGAGAEQPILVAGIDYANDLREWLKRRPDDNQLVASIHSYRGQRCSDINCWNSEVGAVAERVPVVFGEFGSSTDDAAVNTDYMNSLMNWADQSGVGYLAWAWWVLDDEPGPGALALLDNDDGTPRSPLGTTLHTHLAKVATG